MNNQSLIETNLDLPVPPPPGGHYEPVVMMDSLMFVAGQFPFIDGRLAYQGRLGDTVDTATGYQAARLCAINAIAHMQRSLSSLDAVVGLARVEGYLQTAAGFQDHAKVLDGASDLFYQVFGQRGAHTRAVFGVASLPLNSPIELVVTVRIAPQRVWFWQRLSGSNRLKHMRSYDSKFPEGSIWRWPRMQKQQGSGEQDRN